jgi:hypothetical protein
MTNKIGKYKLTNADKKQYNDTALEFYSEEVVDMIKDMTPSEIKELKTPDPDTGEIPWIKILNKLWSSSVRGAKSLMLESLSENDE